MRARGANKSPTGTLFVAGLVRRRTAVSARQGSDDHDEAADVPIARLAINKMTKAGKATPERVKRQLSDPRLDAPRKWGAEKPIPVEVLAEQNRRTFDNKSLLLEISSAGLRGLCGNLKANPGCARPAETVCWNRGWTLAVRPGWPNFAELAERHASNNEATFHCRFVFFRQGARPLFLERSAGPGG